MKITIEDRERGNLVAEFKRENTVSEKRRTGESKSLRLHSVQESCVREAPPHVMRTPYEGRQGPCVGEKNCQRRYRMPNFEEADLMREEMWFPVKILSKR